MHADLKVYPDNDVMFERWNAGVTEAKIDCEQLGMKHADAVSYTHLTLPTIYSV